MFFFRSKVACNYFNYASCSNARNHERRCAFFYPICFLFKIQIKIMFDSIENSFKMDVLVNAQPYWMRNEEILQKKCRMSDQTKKRKFTRLVHSQFHSPCSLTLFNRKKALTFKTTPGCFNEWSFVFPKNEKSYLHENVRMSFSKTM